MPTPKTILAHVDITVTLTGIAFASLQLHADAKNLTVSQLIQKLLDAVSNAAINNEPSADQNKL